MSVSAVSSETVSGWPIEPGRRVRARVSIWDDGEDYRPPDFLCRAGDVLYVLGGHSKGWIRVAHSMARLSSGFVVKPNEVSLHWEQPDLFPHTLPPTNHLKEQHP